MLYHVILCYPQMIVRYFKAAWQGLKVWKLSLHRLEKRSSELKARKIQLHMLHCATQRKRRTLTSAVWGPIFGPMSGPSFPLQGSVRLTAWILLLLQRESAVVCTGLCHMAGFETWCPRQCLSFLPIRIKHNPCYIIYYIWIRNLI